MSVLDRTALEDSPLADLHAIASELGLDGYRRLRKAALIDAILGQDPAAPAGCGRALLNAIEEEAMRRGCEALRLEVRDGNARAINLYERAGFRRIGRCDRYYEDGAAALRFEKTLGAERSPVRTPVPAVAPQGRKPRRRATVR